MKMLKIADKSKTLAFFFLVPKRSISWDSCWAKWLHVHERAFERCYYNISTTTTTSTTGTKTRHQLSWIQEFCQHSLFQWCFSYSGPPYLLSLYIYIYLGHANPRALANRGRGERGETLRAYALQWQSFGITRKFPCHVQHQLFTAVKTCTTFPTCCGFEKLTLQTRGRVPVPRFIYLIRTSNVYRSF